MYPIWGRRERANVVDDCVRGERGGEEVGSVGREAQGRWGVCVAREGVYLLIFADVIYLAGR